MSSALVDALQRPIIATGMKQQIDDAFASVPKGKRAVLLLIHNFDTQTTRVHVAARLGESWKVAAGPGFDWVGKKPTGWVGIGGSW